jgi:hypothetical protein
MSMQIKSALAVAQPYQPTPTELKIWAEIQHWIKNPPIHGKRRRITPWIAEQILTVYNTHNRGPKRGKIKIYAADMRQGSGSAQSPHGWPYTGDTIKFTDANRLGDGQNRLMACIQAQTPFETLMVFGIPDWVFPFLDRGKNRDGGDVLFVEGHSYTTQLAAAIRWAEKLETDPKDRTTIEPSVIVALMRSKYSKGNIKDCLDDARKINSTTKHPVGMIAGLLWHAYRSDQRKAAQFATAWANRGVTKRGSQGTQLAAMILALDSLASQAHGRINDTVRVAWAVQAWNAFKIGKRMTKASYNWTPKDDFPTID